MIKIPLSRGLEATIDDADAALAQHKWYAHVSAPGRVYAARRVRKPDGTSTIAFLHRALLGVTERSIDVDHMSGDTMDNRRANLRLATRTQNVRNRSPLNATSNTGHVGVRENGRGDFVASIKVEDRSKHLGVFSTLGDAVAARRAAEVRLWGELPPRHR